MREHSIVVGGTSSARRLGILGGSFDPVHNGHLAIAEAARQRFSLESVIFVPSYCPPHKARPILAPFEHRRRMIELAVEPCPWFRVSDVESSGHCPSYAGITVEKLKQIYGVDHTYYFITGLDALLTLLDFEKSRTYPGLCHFIATTRPGFYWDTLRLQIPQAFHPYIHINEIPAIAISSSEIRERVRSGNSIVGMVPDAVRNYIEKFRIYRACFT